MEEKRLEYLTMLQIHQSDTPSIDAVIDRFATIAARRLNFLPRDAIRKRGVCCRPVSVYPFVCHVGACIQTAEDIVKLLSRCSSSIIVVFDPECWYPVPRNPFSGAHNTRGWENFAIFD